MTLFKTLLWLEGVRLVAWCAFLAWLLHAYDPATWTSPEASLYAIFASFWLGFPYAWAASMGTGSWDVFRIDAHAPLAIAFTHFGIWLVASGILLGVIHRREPD